MKGTSVRGEGVRGTSSKSAGVFGSGITGVQGQTNAPASSFDSAVFALSPSLGNFLFRGQSPSGTDQFYADTGGNVFANGYVISEAGVYGYAPSIDFGVFGDGAFAGVYASNSYNAPNSAAFYAEGHGGKLYVGKSSGGGPAFTVDDAGNVVAHSFTAGYAASQTTATGSHVMTYATESRSAIVEDFGEASLMGGVAYVRVDPSFTSMMLRGTSYAVFLTPLGEIRGTLFVAKKESAGFTIRETAPGGSNVGIDYRIVARRYVPPAPRDLDLRLPLPHPGHKMGP